MRLTGGGAPFDLRGRILQQHLGSSLRSVTVGISRRDCYEGALDPSGCVGLWQDGHWVHRRADRRISRSLDRVWTRGEAPRARGTFKDSFEVVAATGEGGWDLVLLDW